MTNLSHKRYFFLITILLAPLFCVRAQKGETNIKFRLAQSYEQSGDYDAAVKIYSELYGKDSANAAIFESLRRGYLQLKRYDDAIALFKRALVRNPNDVSLLAQLGTFYMQKSDEQSANESWERAVAVDSMHEVTYRIVGSAMTESRLFDKAIAMYQHGRKACNNPGLFTMDIAYLYTIVLNFNAATKEYISLIRQTPALLPFSQSRMASYTNRPQGLAAATTAVEEAVKKEPSDLTLLQLQSWLYMEGKQFDRAYDICKIIDTKTNAAGRELYNFAERALKEKAYATAARAFQDIIKNFPKFEMRAQVKLGYARTLEESVTADDTLYQFAAALGNVRPSTESEQMYAGVITAYNGVITEFPKTEIAAQSLLRIAILKQERFFELDGARSALETINRDYPAFTGVTTEGTLRLGDIFLAQGDLTKAEQEYHLLDHFIGGGDQHDRAALRLAEIEYFKGNFNNALKILHTLTLNLISDIANDALKLQAFINENMKPSDAALKDFSRAEFLKRQMKFSEASKVYESILKSYPNSSLVDESLMNIGDMQIQTKNYTEAIASYERLVSNFPESIMLDIALMKIGNAYQRGLRNTPKAIEAYEKLLEKYPKSIYVTEARKRIRELRGDTI